MHPAINQFTSEDQSIANFLMQRTGRSMRDADGVEILILMQEYEDSPVLQAEYAGSL